MIKTTWIAACLLALAAGCATEVGEYRNAITGEACEPDPETLVLEAEPPSAGDEGDEGLPECFSNNGHGNNEDGVDSSNPGQGSGGPNGEVDESCDGSGDCIDDEIRPPQGQPGECVVPPGCDDSGCCEVPEDEEPEDEEPEDEEPEDDDPVDEDPEDDGPSDETPTVE